MLTSLRKFDRSDIARERMKMINFYNQYGEKATKEAFGADRRVINRWDKRLRESGGKLVSLIPYSTKPRNVRTPQTHPEILKFIKKTREDHPRIGKEKIKPDLDEHCLKLGISMVSSSTIGNIIKRHHFFLQKQGRAYHNPNSK